MNPKYLRTFWRKRFYSELRAPTAAECKQKGGALENLDFLEDSGGAWNFDNESDIIKSLEASYPEHYSHAVIGTTSDLYSAAFQLNKDNQIVKISLSNSHKLLLQQEIP
jgi:hypothetical protein